MSLAPLVQSIMLAERIIEEFRKIEDCIRSERARIKSCGGNDRWDKNAPWTEKILTSLCRLGREHGFKVGAAKGSANTKNYGEWLYDITWLKYKDDNMLKVLETAALVGESEWGNAGDVKDDFEKLLLARSLVRLMVYDIPNVGDMTEKFKERIQAFRGTGIGDTYLVVAYNNNYEAKNADPQKWWFEYKLFIVEDVSKPPAVLPYPRIESYSSGEDK